MLYLAALFGGNSCMLGKFGGDGVQAVTTTDAADARSMALNLMSKALGHLDSDCNIPPVIGAQLQMAIDTLWTSVSTSQSSVNLH